MPEKNTHTDREAWLNAAALAYAPWFQDQGYPLPAYRVTCGFPAVSARPSASGKSHRIGECWSPKASADGTTEVMISPVTDEPMKILGILFHELVHAAVGVDAGHKGPFKRVALAGGLEGKMTATTEGPTFIARAMPILEGLGPYPHARLDASKSGRKKQGTRLIKCECATCGYTVRTTAKWIAVGLPICPGDEDGDHGEMVAALPEDESGEDE